MPPGQRTTPLDALWQAPALVWVLLAGECLAAVLALAPGATGNRLVLFGLTSLIVQWVSMLTLCGLYLLRRPLARLPGRWLAAVAVGLLTLSAWLISGAAWLLLRSPDFIADTHWHALGWRFVAIALVVGLLGLAVLYNHWRMRQFALKAKQAELEALQARVQPHFLFNTLNTGAALVHQQPDKAENLLLDLADLFRAALAGPQLHALSEELSLARRYLEIEALRFGPRLRVEWKLPDAIPDIAIPTLSIQPLVENAIRHGIEHDADGGDIRIEVTEANGVVDIRICNPASRAAAAGIGHNIGQNAVRARLQALAHGKGELRVGVEGGHYVATIRLPA